MVDNFTTALPRVLVVDDTPANLLAVETIIADCGVDVVCVSSGTEALKRSLDGGFALVLLDVEMPHMDGYETASLLRSSVRTKDIPIIFLTASHSEKREIFRGYESGAVDYILKPLNPMILKSKVKVFAELFRFRENEKATITRQEQEKHEEERRELLQVENDKLKVILENVLVGIAVIEAGTNQLSFANQRFLSIHPLGLATPAFSLDDHPLKAEEYPFTRALEGDTVASDEIIYKGQGGKQINLLTSAVPVREKDGRISAAVASYLDVSDRVAAEEAREIARQQLQYAYKMSALGEMAGGIAHEVNNPLSVIIGKSRQLREEVESPSPDPRLLLQFSSTIEGTAKRLVKIVNGLRTLSRDSERDPFVVTSITALIDETMAICDARFKYENIQPMIEIDTELTIECRPAEISQVILNLISNGLDAVDGCDEKWVKLTAKTAGTYLEMAVENSGAVIPFEDRRKIMQPFFTTKDVGKGTGLGLSISKNIVESHGGTLILDERLAPTRFIVRLPKEQPI